MKSLIFSQTFKCEMHVVVCSIVLGVKVACYKAAIILVTCCGLWVHAGSGGEREAFVLSVGFQSFSVSSCCNSTALHFL